MKIGLCGYAGAGKDTVASLFPGFQRMAFADKVKEALVALDPLVVKGVEMMYLTDCLEEVGSWEELKKVNYVRGLCQRMGTEVGRNLFDADIWVNLVERQLKTAYEDIMFTDVRFPNEGRLVRKYGGILIWIHRPDNPPANAHISEHSIKPGDCDAIVQNSGSLDDLRKAVQDIIENKFSDMSDAGIANHPFLNFENQSLRPADVKRQTERIQTILNQNGCIQQKEAEYLLGQINRLEAEVARQVALKEEQRKAYERML